SHGKVCCTHSPSETNLRRAIHRPKNTPTSDNSSRRNPRMNPRTAKPKSTTAMITSTQFNAPPFLGVLHQAIPSNEPSTTTFPVGNNIPYGNLFHAIFLVTRSAV